MSADTHSLRVALPPSLSRTPPPAPSSCPLSLSLSASPPQPLTVPFALSPIPSRNPLLPLSLTICLSSPPARQRAKVQGPPGPRGGLKVNKSTCLTATCWSKSEQPREGRKASQATPTWIHTRWMQRCRPDLPSLPFRGPTDASTLRLAAGSLRQPAAARRVGVLA